MHIRASGIQHNHQRSIDQNKTIIAFKNTVFFRLHVHVLNIIVYYRSAELCTHEAMCTQLQVGDVCECYIYIYIYNIHSCFL